MFVSSDKQCNLCFCVSVFLCLPLCLSLFVHLHLFQEEKEARAALPHDSPLLSPNSRVLRSFPAMDVLRDAIVKNKNRAQRDEQKAELLALIDAAKDADAAKVALWADGHIARIEAEMEKPGLAGPQRGFYENQVKEWYQFKEGKRAMVI
jgi:hypothetical protein